MNNKRALGYVRVSTDKQQHGPAAQERQIREWATLNGLEIEQIFIDINVSGATPPEKRPGLSSALAAVKRGTTLIAAKRDRFAREPMIMGQLKVFLSKKQAFLATADGATQGDDPAGEFMTTVIDGASKFERRLIASRTAEVLRDRQILGGKAGGTAPYGWEIVGATQIMNAKGRLSWVGGSLKPVQHEQDAIEFAKRLRSNNTSFRKIVKALQSGGYKPRGQRWHLITVTRMLKSTSRPKCDSATQCACSDSPD